MDSEKNNNKYLKIVASIFLVGFSFYILKELQVILLPFFIALIISFLFEPFYKWLRSHKFPAWTAIIIVVLVIIILSNITSVFVVTSINIFKADFPNYLRKIEGFGTNFSVYLSSMGISDNTIKESFDISKFFSGDKLSELLTDVISSIAGIFTDYILILIYIIFLLSEYGSIQKRILKAFSKEGARNISDILNDIYIDVRRYIVGKTLINLTHALLITTIFMIFGLDFAIVWGLLTFFLTYIPNLGVLISTVLPFLTALAQYDNIVTPIILLIVMGVIGYLIGNLVEPKILGDRLNLSPILLIFSLVFWGYLWGVVGMLLSVPIMSMIKIVLSKFESTRPLSILMSYEVVSAKKDKKQTEIAFK
jgi:predicted PurR-regulated permease PerM